jgi:hypothetical protein
MHGITDRGSRLIPAKDSARSVTCALQLLPAGIAIVEHERPYHQSPGGECFVMKAYIVSEGRLFALKPSEWSMLLVGVALCGFATLLF